MIKSSKISIKYSNTNKKNNLKSFIDEYQKVMKLLIDILWYEVEIPKLITKQYTDQVKDKTWLTARAIQSAAKQVSAIIRGTKKKNEQRQYIHDKLVSEGQFKKARKLKRIIEKNNYSKPIIDNICPELDVRLAKIDLDNETSFDGWLHLSSLGNKLVFDIPFKRTKHFNKMNKLGKLKSGIRLLSNNEICFNFELEDVPKKKSGKILGIDIGIKKVISCSNSYQTKPDIHNWNLTKIQQKLARKKKGSKAFGKTQNHRNNYINWSINQLNLKDVMEVKIENIKYLRKNVKSSRFMSHWNYTKIFDKLKDKCELSGVQITTVSPTYTSQRCSQCGWVRKTNRKGEQFKCTSCGFAADADLNASKNISFNLPRISKKKRLLNYNRKGFYYNLIGEKRIVSHT